MINSMREATDMRYTKEQNYKFFAQIMGEALKSMPPKLETRNQKKLENLSIGETQYNRASRLSQVISNQVGIIDHLQKMTLMLEKRRDGLLRDLDRRQAARREHNAMHAGPNRDATDIETQAQA